MDSLAKQLDERLHEWAPETTNQVRQVVSELIGLADGGVLEQVAEQTLHSSAEADLSLPLPLEEDPLVGLFSGSPNLATDAKKILSQEVTATSGFTWKEA